MKKIKILSILGTRPEAVKMAPVIRELQRNADRIESIVLSTSQHRQMLDPILTLFEIRPDRDLNIMRPDQTLTHITTAALQGVGEAIGEIRPDVVLVQGDTTTVFAAALAAFYHKVPVGHVEAGLRSFDRYNPYPEEINRRLADVVTEFYFAPTSLARENLLKEGVPPEKVFVTGNTVVDAFLYALQRPHSLNIPELAGIDLDRGRILLVTAHRRENWDAPLANICEAFKDLVGKFQDLRIVYPVHLNPNVRKTVFRILQDVPRVHLIEPLDYLSFIHLMKRSYLILTDSGGVQEEAPSIGKPVLVMRKVTERPEAYQAGVARIVGTEKENLINEVSALLEDPEAYQKMTRVGNPYGDGKAAERIVAILLERFSGYFRL